MLDEEKEESRDVPGLALSVSLPTDVSFNFLAFLCIRKNGCPFLFFSIAVLIFPGHFRE